MSMSLEVDMLGNYYYTYSIQLSNFHEVVIMNIDNIRIIVLRSSLIYCVEVLYYK